MDRASRGRPLTEPATFETTVVTEEEGVFAIFETRQTFTLGSCNICSVGRLCEDIIAATCGFALGPGNCFKFLSFRPEKLIYAFDVKEPLLESICLVDLQLNAATCQGVRHSGIDAMTQLFLREARGCTCEEGIFCLDADGKIPKRVRSLGHPAELAADIFLPILVKETGTKFCHECREGEREDPDAVGGKPIFDAGVLQARENFSYLFILGNLFVLEISEASVFEFVHDLGRDVPWHENRGLRHRALFDNGNILFRFGIGRHNDTKTGSLGVRGG
jgi:hypothetical protein